MKSGSSSFFVPLFHYIDDGEGDKRAYQESIYHLMEGMLAQNHPAGAYQSAYYQAETEPLCGVETEDFSVCQYASRYATYGCGMRGNLQPDVCEGTYYLGEERCEDYDAEEMWEMEYPHQIETHEVTGDGDDVWHHTSFPTDEPQHRPSLVAAVEMYEHRGYKDGEQIYHHEDKRLVLPREDGEIAEHEEQHRAHQWQIEWGENDADKARGDYGSSLEAACGLPGFFAFRLGEYGYFAHFFVLSFLLLSLNIGR